MAFMQEFLNFGACFSTQILYNRFQKSQATGLWKRFQKSSEGSLKTEDLWFYQRSKTLKDL